MSARNSRSPDRRSNRSRERSPRREENKAAEEEIDDLLGDLFDGDEDIDTSKPKDDIDDILDNIESSPPDESPPEADDIMDDLFGTNPPGAGAGADELPTGEMQVGGATSSDDFDMDDDVELVGGAIPQPVGRVENEEAPDYYTKLRAGDEINPKQQKDLERRLQHIKIHGVQQWLKRLVLDGKKQLMLMKNARAFAKKRFFLEEKGEKVVNCPSFVEENLNAWLGRQNVDLSAVFDWKEKDFNKKDGGSEKTFVLSINWAGLHKFMKENGQDDKAGRLRRSHQVESVVAVLEKRIYDSSDGLVEWSKAKAALKVLLELEMPLAEFKKANLGKVVAPYRKHKDKTVMDLTKKIIAKYRALEEEHKKNPQKKASKSPARNNNAGEGNGNGAAATSPMKVDSKPAADEDDADLDDLF